MQYVIELRSVERLGEQRHLRRIAQPVQLGIQDVAADEDESVQQLALLLPEAVVEGKAAPVGHPDVAEDDVVLIAFDEGRRHLPVDREIDQEAASRQEPLQQGTDRLLIVGHQRPLTRHIRSERRDHVLVERSRLRVGGGEDQPEAGALSLAREDQRATVCPGDPEGDRQTQAGALSHFFGRKERFEDSSGHAGGYARTRVVDFDGDVRFVDERAHPKRAVAADRLERVLGVQQQIEQHLLDFFLIDAHSWQVGRVFRLDLDVGHAQFVGAQGDRALHEVVEAGRCAFG